MRCEGPPGYAPEEGGMPPLLVSACLLGLRTRVDGGARGSKAVAALGGTRTLVPMCPEQLGGLPTPRSPAEIQGGTGEDVLDGRVGVKTERGVDVTEAFLRGARQTLEVARAVKATGAVLKAGSPSCGIHQTGDGTFSGRLREGPGVCAALLAREGLFLLTEEDLEDEADTRVEER